jgi:hypothetical protein
MGTMREVQILPQTEGKGRTFKALLLASVEADLLWTGGQTVSDNLRPVWAMFAGSEQELRAFTANLLSGRKAVFPKNNGWRRRKEDQLEILRSAGYQTTWQREAEGSIVTLYLPDLFQMDPGMVDPDGVRFVLLPTKEWTEAQNLDVAPVVRHAKKVGFDLDTAQLVSLAPLAYLFCAYLDRRTRCPLVSDGRFYLQLMLACLQKGLASFSTDADPYYRRDAKEFGQHHALQYHEVGTTEVGLVPGLVFRSDHETLETLLAEQVATFFSSTKGSHRNG